MKNWQKKRGFTTIEAVILFAVIALLAAILIPTFISLSEKAKRSADEKAVLEMNKVLIKNEDGDKKADGALMAYAQIEEAGLVLDYETLSKHLDTCYDSMSNRFVLYKVNSDGSGGKVVYPSDFAGDVISEIKRDAEEEGRYYKLYEGQSNIPSISSKDYGVGENGELLVDGEPLSGINKSTTYGEYGLYYNEGKLYSGTVGEYTYSDGMLVVDATVSNGQYNYTLPGDAGVVTNKIVLKTSGENGIDETMSAVAAGNNTVRSQVTVSGTDGHSYSLSSVRATLTFDLIEELENAIAEGTARDYIMGLYSDVQTRNYLPNITLGRDFVSYLSEKFGSESLTEEIYTDYLENYAFSDNSFTNYLFKLHSERSIKDMGWAVQTARNDEEVVWGASKFDGLIGGKDANETDEKIFKVVEPEVVLTFWKLLYTNTLFTAVCDGQTEGNNLSGLITDSNTLDAMNNFYMKNTSGWMSQVSNEYGVQLSSWANMELGADVTGLDNLGDTETAGTLSFEIVAGSHKILNSNIWNGCTFGKLEYEIILEVH